MQHLLRAHYLQRCIALFVADCLVFSFVNPAKASAPWLIIGYILLGLTLLSLLNLAAMVLKTYGKHPYALGRRLFRYVGVVAIALIGLQSIGQLTTRDVVTLLPMALIAYIYFSYSKKATTE